MKRSDIQPMPAFFDRYINLVADVDIFEAFEKYTPEAIYSEVNLLKELGDRVYAPEKWTVNDILQHVIDTERIMSYRALRFSRNDETTLPGFEEELFAANTIAGQRSFEELMQEFSALRTATVLLFKGMNDEMMLRSGVAFKSRISALALGYVIMGHALHHMTIIRERYFPLLS